MVEHDEYESFVAHPRYGQPPRVTGLNPEPTSFEPGVPYVHLHWYSGPDCRIANTAIVADVSKQLSATVPVTHDYDTRRICRDCARSFIFFAEEQCHWYEELGFRLDADCIRCVPCRNHEQGIAQLRQRYEELFHVAERSDEESLEMAECRVALIEASAFSPRQTERVRMLLHRVADTPRYEKRMKALLARVATLESGSAQS